jgi:hypothetical protein
MDAGRDLGQLVGITEQDDQIGRAGDREGVGQRVLSGLVDEQHADDALHLLARPQPGCAAHLERPPGPIADGVVVVEPLDAGDGRTSSLSVLWTIRGCRPAASAAGRPPRGVQMTRCDWAVTPTGIPRSASSRIIWAAV